MSITDEIDKEKLRDELLALVREAALAGAVITYDGGEDDGSVQDVSLYATPENLLAREYPVTTHDGAKSLRDKLADAAWELTLAYFGIWYDGSAGAEGEVIVDANQGTVVVHHGQRVSSIEYLTRVLNEEPKEPVTTATKGPPTAESATSMIAYMLDNPEPSKEALLTVLAENDIGYAVVEYDGAGDSGAIERVDLWRSKDDAERQSNVSPVVTLALTVESPAAQTLLENYVWNLLEAKHPGWEINEGSYGKVTVDVAAQTVTLEHGERVEDVEWHEEEL